MKKFLSVLTAALLFLSVSVQAEAVNVIVAKNVVTAQGERVIQSAAATYHSAAITEDGCLYMWGDNYYGQLGNGNSGGNLGSLITA